MRNTLIEDIKILLKDFLNKDSTLNVDKWKKAIAQKNDFSDTLYQDDSGLSSDSLSNILYQNYIQRIDVTTQFNKPNIESVKPYQLNYNVRRFWFKEKDSTLATEPNQIVALQEGMKILLKQGEYIDGGELESLEPLGNDKESLKNVKNFVYVYLPQKTFRQRDNFYVKTYGDFLLRNYYEPIIRFYFSLDPKREEVQQFVEKIKDFFNDRRIPFQLKTPLQLNNFGRADTLVLYVAQNHFFYIKEFIIELRDFARRKEILRTNIPLFIRKIYEGIGFAEDPFEDESFGMQRVRLIIEIVNELLTNNQNVTIDVILRKIVAKGYKVDEFYKNPYTNFNYDFDQFENTASVKDYASRMVKPLYYKYNELALEYALDLVEKAVWDKKDELLWFSYGEKDSSQPYYHIISEEETNDIYWFLGNIVQISYNRQFFTNPILQIIDREFSLPTKQQFYKERMQLLQKRVEELKEISFDSFEKNFKTWIENGYMQWSGDELKKKQTLFSYVQKVFWKPFEKESEENELPKDIYKDLSKEESRKVASELYPFAKMAYPIPNKFKNYEYCPTDEGKLRIASIMLYVYSPDLYKKPL